MAESYLIIRLMMDAIVRCKNSPEYVGWSCLCMVTQSLWDGVVLWVSVLLPGVLQSLKIIIGIYLDFVMLDLFIKSLSYF